MANGSAGFRTFLDRGAAAGFGPVEGGLELGRRWGDGFLSEAPPDAGGRFDVPVRRTDEILEIVIPPEMTEGDPAMLAFEWE